MSEPGMSPVPEAAPQDVLPVQEQRLHPLSWLFVLIASLKQFILPLLLVLVFGRGDRNELWGLVAVAVLALVSLWQYFTYRYRVGDDSLLIRSGFFERSLREIPFARIHNVALHQSLLHRLFGVAEVRLESAGGEKPEAEMRVLRLSEALALEALIRRHARGESRVASADAAVAEDARTLLALPMGEVVRHGIVSNRGMLVVGAAAVAMSQYYRTLPEQEVEDWARQQLSGVDVPHYGPMQYVVGVLVVLLAFVLLLQLLSIGLSLLQYYGFRLSQVGPRLTMERGLLTRMRSSTPKRRIQAWTLYEGVLHRLLRRRALQVDTATSRYQSEQRAFRDVAPIATHDACDGLVREILPGVAWPPQGWQHLHKHTWLRLAIPGVLFSALLVAVLAWNWGVVGLSGLLWLPWALFAARRNAMRAGYHVDRSIIAVREGWWSRHWRFAELDKLQVVCLRQGPIDRRFGMASISMDTAGAGSFAPPLRIRYLPIDAARELHARLGREIARRPLHW